MSSIYKPYGTSWSSWNYTSHMHYVHRIETWKALHLVDHKTPLFMLGAGLLSNNSNCGCRCINWIQLHKLTKIVSIYKQTCMAGVDITVLRTLSIFQPLDYIIRKCFVLWYKKSSCGSNSTESIETCPTKNLDLFWLFLSFRIILKNLPRFYFRKTPLTESFEIEPVLYDSQNS